MSNINEWPLVKPDDDGIRPAGESNKCLYCHQNVGTEHLKDCVTVKHRVYIKVEFALEIEVPYSWTPEEIEFHHGQSSWCANNIVRDIEQYLVDNSRCLCDEFRTIFIREVDSKPISRTRSEAIDRDKRLYTKS